MSSLRALSGNEIVLVESRNEGNQETGARARAVRRVGVVQIGIEAK